MGNECTRLEKEKKKKMLVPQKEKGIREGGTGGRGWGGSNLARRRIKLERKTQNIDPYRARGRRGIKEIDRIN